MGIFYQRHLDCSVEGNDYYDNTPERVRELEYTPRTIHFRWSGSREGVRVQFYNYASYRPSQLIRTSTTRGSLGLQQRTCSDMIVDMKIRVQVPPNAMYFRTIDPKGHYSELQPVYNNNVYFYEGGHVYQIYTM